MKTILLTDSCCDLPLDYVHEHQSILEIIGMPIHIGVEDFVDQTTSRWKTMRLSLGGHAPQTPRGFVASSKTSVYGQTLERARVPLCGTAHGIE